MAQKHPLFCLFALASLSLALACAGRADFGPNQSDGGVLDDVEGDVDRRDVEDGGINLPDVNVPEIECVVPPSRECQTTLSQSVVISSPGDIQNLEGVDCIDGDLRIQSTLLLDLNGLESLKQISGRLSINQNELLSSVEGLSGLESVGVLSIVANLSLSNLNGFQNIRVIGALDIINNTNLRNLSAFEQLRSVEENMSIRFHTDLIALGPFACLSDIGLELDISHNDLLNSIEFRGLEQSGELIVDDNPALSQLSFPELIELDGLTIRDNSDLISIEGLSSLELVNGDFIIRNNDALRVFPDVEIQSTQSVVIIENTAITSLEPLRFSSVGGAVGISNNPGLIELVAFSDVERVENNLTVTDNALLANLDFSALNAVGDSLVIVDNDALVNLDSFSSLTSVGDELYVAFNDLLEDLDGLAALETPLRNLGIERNPSLLEIRLPGPAQISGQLVIMNGNAERLHIGAEDVGHYFVSEMRALTHIESNALTRTGDFSLLDNPELSTLSFNAFERVDEFFTVAGNRSLSRETIESLIELIDEREGFENAPFAEDNGL